MNSNAILIEGYTPDEILGLPDADVRALVVHGETMVIRIGTAEMLGCFSIKGDRLVVELAHIEGGGEGVLPALWVLTERYARQSSLAAVEWLVHAVHCARPNLKLRRLLERRGFIAEEIEGVGECYHYVHLVSPAVERVDD
jgi:hypothetical protein